MEFPSGLITALRNASRISALTGAGVSAESGIPTFREAQTGLWAQYDPTELATPFAFQVNPDLVWGWYAWRRDLCASASPNPAHAALVEVEARCPGFTLITQNVDNLHQRAGSAKPIELHGNIFRTRCSEEGTIIKSWQDNGKSVPHCPNCGAHLRPDVVWFTENLPGPALSAAIDAARGSEVFLVIGTSGLVEPAASLPRLAGSAGAVIVEINPGETPLSSMADYSLRGNAGPILSELCRHISCESR